MKSVVGVLWYLSLLSLFFVILLSFGLKVGLFDSFSAVPLWLWVPVGYLWFFILFSALMGVFKGKLFLIPWFHRRKWRVEYFPFLNEKVPFVVGRHARIGGLIYLAMWIFISAFLLWLWLYGMHLT